MIKLKIIGNNASDKQIISAIQKLQKQHNEVHDEIRDIKKNLRVNAHFPRRNTD